MSPSDETPRTDLPRYPVSLARAVAPWKRSANATTVLPESQSVVTGWRPDRERLAAYRSLVGSGAELPIAFPQLPIMALHIDLLSQWSFPVRALGLVHQGAVIDVLDELPVGRAVGCAGRGVRGSARARGARVRRLRRGQRRWRPVLALHVDLPVPQPVGQRGRGVGRPAARLLGGVGGRGARSRWPEGTGRAFGRVTGDINPIHLHAVPAKAFGFPRAIAHGWWTTGRAAAELGVDEAVPGRRLEIAFRRPIVLPSTPILCSRSGGVRRGRVRAVPGVARRPAGTSRCGRWSSGVVTG